MCVCVCVRLKTHPHTRCHTCRAPSSSLAYFLPLHDGARRRGVVTGVRTAPTGLCGVWVRAGECVCWYISVRDDQNVCHQCVYTSVDAHTRGLCVYECMWCGCVCVCVWGVCVWGVWGCVSVLWCVCVISRKKMCNPKKTTRAYSLGNKL